MADPFKYLGLESSATPDEVRARFRELAITQHPDHGGTDEGMRLLRLFYEEALAQATDRPCATCGGDGVLVKVHGFSTLSVLCPDCGFERRKS